MHFSTVSQLVRGMDCLRITKFLSPCFVRSLPLGIHNTCANSKLKCHRCTRSVGDPLCRDVDILMWDIVLARPYGRDSGDE